MPDFRPVYEDEGEEFSLRVEQAAVTHAGRSWLQNRVVVQQGRPGVVVVPVSGDDIALIRIHRPVVGRSLLELPRGLGENEPVDDARRELREETGLDATDLHPLGSFVLDSGLVPTEIAGFVATVDRAAPPAPTDGEAIEVVWVSRSELLDLVQRGEIEDAISLAAVARWLSRSA